MLHAPALQEERNKLDEQMMRNVRRATRDAEAVLFLVDAGARPEDALPLLRPYCGRGLPVAVVLNKARFPCSGTSGPQKYRIAAHGLSSLSTWRCACCASCCNRRAPLLSVMVNSCSHESNSFITHGA